VSPDIRIHVQEQKLIRKQELQIYISFFYDGDQGKIKTNIKIDRQIQIFTW